MQQPSPNISLLSGAYVMWHSVTCINIETALAWFFFVSSLWLHHSESKKCLCQSHIHGWNEIIFFGHHPMVLLFSLQYIVDFSLPLFQHYHL